MDLGNEVDLSNNNITPLWKRLNENDMKPKPRPLSYQIDGVLMTDFPVDDRCTFTLKPAEKITTTASNTTVLKHTLNKPVRTTRVARSISIGYLSNGLFSLSKFSKLDDEKDEEATSSPKTTLANKNGNGLSVWRDITEPFKRLSSQFTLTSQRDQMGNVSPLPCTVSPKNIVSSQNFTRSPPLQLQDAHGSPVDFCSSPSHSSTSSIPSIYSNLSLPSDPPTPRTPSPAERTVGILLQRQSSESPQGLEGKQPIILSTHSPTAHKIGTQQIIPRGLVSDTRLSKPSQMFLDNGKSAFRPRSMFETGSSFSTSKEDDLDGDENAGLLTRGQRSKSYRRAVVSGVDIDVPSLDPKAKRLSQPVLKGVAEERLSCVSPSNSKNVERKKGLLTQRTFDSEEEEVLYQNYQEKALHNDSDEDTEPKQPQPDESIVVQYKPIRTSWSQLSVVKKSGKFEKLSQEERKRQEAIFEVISSEHSYLHSLEILVRLFKNSNELSEIINKTDHHHLFSNIVDVCDASKKFFKELKDRHQQNIVINDISDIVLRHAQSNFDPYVTYCSNEVYQQRTLQRLLNKSPSIKEVLTRIEAHPDCRNLPMISFLILPMQRVTRLPLLMDTICQKTPKDSASYEACKKALHFLSKLVRKCNEGARTMERTEMLYTINSQLEFKIKPFPLVSSSRWMVKRGELTAFVEGNGIFSKKTSRQQVYFFLFNDVLIVTRKKGEESYTVIDYALRDQIYVGSCQAEDLNLSSVRGTAGMLTSRQNIANHLLQVRFRSNHSGNKVTMILGVELPNERARWISALGQINSNDKNNRMNTMQVEVTRTYTARQPDELSLQVADVVLVSQTVDAVEKTRSDRTDVSGTTTSLPAAQGWYEGVRLRDGERGWFLAECAELITCQATIEKNMQRMDRLQGLETNV
ncbi:rho guanine nucleotide exchange factor 26 isoform X1 [Carassius auratus]|uniref:Rho guanine nucleotide exchange factor 26 isoform X1 n=1 Tax=Carassius auratus TaxID=7957 RepID=A0A6P6RDK6_CARAU|nr:rho guanine nucleotide exchange factor 26 isoform X1 [Carassius auratus]